MKRIDLMTKEEIAEILTQIDCINGKCKIQDYCTKVSYMCLASCSATIGKWLNEEVEMKPRIAFINTVDEFDRAKEEFECICRNSECDFGCRYNSEDFYGDDRCFNRFLKEEVEVINK